MKPKPKSNPWRPTRCVKLTFPKIKQVQFSSQLGLRWYVCWHVDWKICFPKSEK